MILRSLAFFLLSVTALRADLVVVQDVDAMGQQMTMTLKTKGTMLRMDLNPQMSMLVDSSSGEMKTLMHDQKMFMSMNMDTIKSMMPAAAKKAPTEKPLLKALGNHQKINGYDTEEYLFTQGEVVSHLWIAKDFPHYEAFIQAMDAMRKGPIGQMSPQLQMDMSELPGLPLKSVVEMNGKLTGTSTMKTIEEKDLPASDFAPPADYKPLTMPTLPPSAQ